MVARAAMYDARVQVDLKSIEPEPELRRITTLGHHVVDSRATANRITRIFDYTFIGRRPNGVRSHEAPRRTRFRTQLGLGALRNRLRITDETGRQFGDDSLHVFNRHCLLYTS